METFARQLAADAKVLDEDEATGAKKFRYIKTGTNHFSLAFTYARGWRRPTPAAYARTWSSLTGRSSANGRDADRPPDAASPPYRSAPMRHAPSRRVALCGIGPIKTPYPAASNGRFGADAAADASRQRRAKSLILRARGAVPVTCDPAGGPFLEPEICRLAAQRAESPQFTSLGKPLVCRMSTLERATPSS